MSIIDKTSEYFMTDLFGKVNMFIGVSDYEFLRKVPDEFKSQLPSIEKTEDELVNMERETDQ